MSIEIIHKTVLVLFLIVGFLTENAGVCSAQEFWQEHKGEHFIVKYALKQDMYWAKDVLTRAEQYYDRTARDLGLSRYGNFWTWDNRVEILIYPGKEKYVQETGSPVWSKASSVGHKQLLEFRKILTYRQEEEFLKTVLPHEISHLILRDFIGVKNKLPVWFEEGIAQLQEEGQPAQAHEIIKYLVRREIYIPLYLLVDYDIRQEEDPKMVTMFYAQSVSLVDFLIKKYGVKKFAALCSLLRDGRDFLDSLFKTYHPHIDSLEDYEKKWLKHMKKEFL